MSTTTLDDLLAKTSRTFALAIPLLPEPLRAEVTVAYLLFRIADTFEDSPSWAPERRIQALADFSLALEAHDPARLRDLAAAWSADPPIRHAGYAELLRELPAVLETHFGLPDRGREIIREHVQRTNAGMAGFVGRSPDGSLALADVEDLRGYCYVVAGIVGEMLTELFLAAVPALAPRAPDLRARARDFGEGLQLVNILKDSADDATEGRSFLPATVGRPQVFELARADLLRAGEYVLGVQRAGAPKGVVAFNALPVLLAWATLDRVEAQGPGAKITRAEVFAITAAVNAALEAGAPVIPGGRIPIRAAEA